MTFFGNGLEWWRRDRVRVSPAVCRLLTLEPHCVTLLDDEAIEVLEKHVRGQTVYYLCRTPRGHEVLRVTAGHLHQAPSYEWEKSHKDNSAAKARIP